jgi:NAD(P)-dependent dehydrogenase (short-subunit alcohol dehydrogenase family)
MKNVVITGSSRGLGFGLAEAFLSRNCTVCVSGRSEESTQNALEKLRRKYHPERLAGIPCDVRVPEQVQALWDYAVNEFGEVNYWINNAGITAPVKVLWKLAPQITREVIETNVLGVIYGTQVAIKGMLAQNHGSIYSVEGMGSDGRTHVGLTIYGTTKYGLKYFMDALVEETSETPLIIGALRPGMVVTDLILDQYRGRPEEWKKVRKIFNIIADRVENVSPWLVDQMLANQKTGRRIKYLTGWGLMMRFLTMPFTKRDVFSHKELDNLA